MLESRMFPKKRNKKPTLNSCHRHSVLQIRAVAILRRTTTMVVSLFFSR